MARDAVAQMEGLAASHAVVLASDRGQGKSHWNPQGVHSDCVGCWFRQWQKLLGLSMEQAHHCEPYHSPWHCLRISTSQFSGWSKIKVNSSWRQLVTHQLFLFKQVKLLLAGEFSFCTEQCQAGEWDDTGNISCSFFSFCVVILGFCSTVLLKLLKSSPELSGGR